MSDNDLYVFDFDSNGAVTAAYEVKPNGTLDRERLEFGERIDAVGEYVVFVEADDGRSEYKVYTQDANTGYWYVFRQGYGEPNLAEFAHLQPPSNPIPSEEPEHRDGHYVDLNGDIYQFDIDASRTVVDVYDVKPDGRLEQERISPNENYVVIDDYVVEIESERGLQEWSIFQLDTTTGYYAEVAEGQGPLDLTKESLDQVMANYTGTFGERHDHDDHFAGGDGDDLFSGADGNDGDDHYEGGDGHDVVEYAGRGATLVNLRELGPQDTGHGYDSFSGIEGIRSGEGDDDLVGDDDNNEFESSDGHDTVHGGGGDDTIRSGRGNDEIHGDDGDDDIRGEHGEDTLSGGSGVDTIRGGGGDDRLLGDDGDDRLFGQQGSDDIDGGLGSDYINGGGGNDILEGGAGRDRLIGGRGDDSLSGGSDNDRLLGHTGNDTLRGGDGNDHMIGGAGFDRLFGGTGDDTLEGSAGRDQLLGGRGNDSLSGGLGTDRLFGGGGDDTLEGSAGRDRLLGGNGNDSLSGGAGSDRLFGNAGDDTLNGGKGKDVLHGGAGSDTFIFNRGDGADNIDDFDVAEDVLLISASLADGLTATDIANLAVVTQEGVLLDFGNSDHILLEDLNSVSGLAATIDII